MSEEDKKLQKYLVEEMMKVRKTNPDVMYYMESLMEYCLKIEKENNKQKEVLDKIKEYIKENACYDKDIKQCCRDLLTDECDYVLELLEEIE